MAPTCGKIGKLSPDEVSTGRREPRKGSARRGRGIATRAQLHAQAIANFFKDRILLEASKSMEIVEKDLWDQVKAMPIEEVR